MRPKLSRFNAKIIASMRAKTPSIAVALVRLVSSVVLTAIVASMVSVIRPLAMSALSVVEAMPIAATPLCGTAITVVAMAVARPKSLRRSGH